MVCQNTKGYYSLCRGKSVVGQNVLTRKVIALKDTIPDFNYFGEAIQSDQSHEVLQNAQNPILTRSRVKFQHWKASIQIETR